MIERFERFLRRIRRWISRTEWGIRLLRLPRSSGTEAERGLVLIQIDGLARRQFERGLAEGRMPFLASLRDREGYELHTFFSGLPASTPAVQGEILYGVRCAVPAFGFLDGDTGEEVRMFDADAARRVEQRLQEQGKPLLLGGSAYSNIYTGGAAEPHLCAASAGWGEFARAVNPIAMAGVFVLHGGAVLRAIALFFLEIGLAIYDCIQGLIAGHALWEEIKFISRRVAVSILMREAVTIGAEMDAARGLPIIHLNYLGYDEQSHRRGPGSRFAHWTLKGIDGAIRRVWRAARRSGVRDYDVWIYSDHGQIRSLPYEEFAGCTIEEAVTRVHGELERTETNGSRREPGSEGEASDRFEPESVRPGRMRSTGPVRSAWMRRRRRPAAGAAREGPALPRPSPYVIAPGPLGHIYLDPVPRLEAQFEFARALVARARIPLVLVPIDSQIVRAFSASGEFTLPGDAAEVLGPDHPLLEPTAAELVSVCQHRDAGTLVICGWQPKRPPITFAYENGSHAGPSPDELQGFALLPDDAPIPNRPGRDYIRGADLRDAANQELGRSGAAFVRRPRSRVSNDSIRILTYNVHSCVGMDGRLSPDRIARVIAHCRPDIVALQELDVHRGRTRSVHQAHVIAQALEMNFEFHPAIRVAEEQYGNAVLSRYPMQLVRAAELPTLPIGWHPEPRGAMWVAITIEGCTLQLINTHFGLHRRERALQAEAIIGPEWLGHPDCRPPVIVCGDFNDQPYSLTCRRLRGVLQDAQLAVKDHRPINTWLGRYPFRRIDHVFVGADVAVSSIRVPRNEMTRVASDHLPLLVEIKLVQAAVV